MQTNRPASTTLRFAITLTLLALTPALTPAQNADWPTWRGPTSDGHAARRAQPPLRWGEDHNIRFKVELPGLGNSSPIVRGDRIYLTTAIDVEGLENGAKAGPQPGPPNADQDHDFVVLALDRTTGEEVWRRVVTRAKPHEKGHPMTSHASASVVCTGDRIVAFFGSRGLYGLDHDGEVVWSKQFNQMKTLAGFGEGASPALHGDTLVLQWDEHGPSFVAAFDVRTGKELWRRPRKTDSSWGTPVITEVDGVTQVILTGSNATRAYALATGKPVWSCGGMSQNPVNSPLLANGVLYVMNSYKGRVIQAIPLAGAKGELDPGKDVLWTLKKDAAYVPPPLVVDGRLYYLRDSTGVLNCLDAATGETVYRGQRLEGVKRVHASPIAAAGRLYFTSRGGRTLVVRAGAKFELLATNTLDDVFDATPAFVGKQIFLRGRSRLYCIAVAE
jgi:outer membrane protein assembly factor BamB